jgi:HlyD family secretion protein
MKGITSVKRVLFWLIAVGIAVAIGAAGYNHFVASNSSTQTAKYRTATVQRGEIKRVVNSTGSVKPVRSVQVGSFVSGPIKEVYVDFNDDVKEGQLMAQVDKRLYIAAKSHEEAALVRSNADVPRINALLAQASSNERRARKLKETNAIAETDLDLCIAEKKSLEAQLEAAEATIAESKANLNTANANLEFTDITSPVDGIVIDRKIDPGQTVAAQFQTPTLFVVAPDLKKKIYVYASVDEADIGLIRDAKERDQPVSFTVDAYPNDIFEGKIWQIRLNPTTVQNVVTFTVVVEAANLELKLLPDMTVNLSFQIERRTGVLTVPNSAFRLKLKPEQVNPRDRAILEEMKPDGQPSQKTGAAENSEENRGAKQTLRDSNKKYVWVVDGEFLSAVQVEVGLSDKTASEIVSGNLKEGQEVVIGLLQ